MRVDSQQRLSSEFDLHRLRDTMGKRGKFCIRFNFKKITNSLSLLELQLLSRQFNRANQFDYLASLLRRRRVQRRILVELDGRDAVLAYMVAGRPLPLRDSGREEAARFHQLPVRMEQSRAYIPTPRSYISYVT